MKKGSARPWVAYVGPFHYPEGGAAARRVRGVAESLSMAGLDVVIASGAGDEPSELGQSTTQEDGISWCLLGERVAEHWPRPLRRFRYAWMGRRTVEWLASMESLPAAVIVYSGYTPYLQRLLPWCRRNGVRLLFDAVEWYEPTSLWGYLLSPYQWNIEWAMRRLVPRVDGVIAISRYLADYYSARGVPVALMPPTTSLIDDNYWSPAHGLRLCYAGQPGNKDELGIILQAVRQLVDQGAQLELTVAGPSRVEVLRLLGSVSGSPPVWLQTPGMLPHADVRKLVGESDFTILVRRNCRVSMAGFSTKFVESLALGTPVIANLTGDLGLHLADGGNGLVCKSPTVQGVTEALARALLLSDQQKKLMRQDAVRHAMAAFHPAGYARVAREIVEQGGKGTRGGQ